MGAEYCSFELLLSSGGSNLPAYVEYLVMMFNRPGLGAAWERDMNMGKSTSRIP